MKRLASIVFAGQVAEGCASMPSKSLKSRRSVDADTSQGRRTFENQQVHEWLESEAFVEWQVARLAVGCNEVATATRSPAARREALRPKGPFASSSYALMSGRKPLVQVLNLTTTAVPSHRVWVEEGRAASEFGPQAKAAELAMKEILAQPEMIETLTALKQLSKLPQALPDRLRVLNKLDQRLAAMPAELATAVARQPELKETLARVNKPRSR